jgi:hypothetical protein
MLQLLLVQPSVLGRKLNFGHTNQTIQVRVFNEMEMNFLMRIILMMVTHYFGSLMIHIMLLSLKQRRQQ